MNLLYVVESGDYKYLVFDGNLQELSVEAVEYLTGPKGYSRGQAFNIIREWAKEFTEKYGNCDFDGSYYDEIDEFIDKKLGTI